jgi:hypothetical protein
MSLSINTACRSPKTSRYWIVLLALLLSLTTLSLAQDIEVRAPSGAVAGEPASISTTGSGSATFYLEGPSIALKRDVQLGQEIQLSAREMEGAGRYVATICSSSCSSSVFFAAAGKPSLRRRQSSSKSVPKSQSWRRTVLKRRTALRGFAPARASLLERCRSPRH